MPWRTGRLVDRPEAGPPASLVIGSTAKRALRGPQPEYVFPLDGAPPRPTLLFAAGIASDAGLVRFEVALRRPGAEPVVLHRMDVEAGAWVDGRVELAGHDLDGAELMLRRVAPGAPDLLGRSGWGDPVLLPEHASDPAPAVILISLDTLRADALGVHGAAGDPTPAIDALAAEGVQYLQAYSPSVWTLPSHESLLTGRYPSGFGDLDEAGRIRRAKHPSAPSAPTLASLLRRAGYLTAAFTGGGWVDSTVGMSNRRSFADGFDSYFGYRRPPLSPAPCHPDRLDGEAVFGAARAWLRARGAAPFLLFVHTYEAHDRCPFGAAHPVGKGNRHRWWDKRRPDGKRQVEALYEDLVARTDGLVAELLDELARVGRADDTLVVLTSDHGEFFGEHGDDGHGSGKTPYDELTRVPLLLRFPGRLPADARVDQPVTVTSVAGTILALLQQETPLPEAPLPGLGLRPEPPRVVYVDAQDLLAVRDGRWKLITSRTSPGRARLFDVEADPGERHDLSRRAVKVRRRLQGLARAYWTAAGPEVAETAAPEAAGAPPEPELQEQLRQLGYVE